MLAGRYTLLEQTALDELLPLCVERGIGVVAAGVFNSGLLARSRPAPNARYNYAEAPAELVERAERIAEVCERHGTTLPAAALAFPLAHPAVVSVCIGARSSEQVERNAALYRRRSCPSCGANCGRRGCSAKTRPLQTLQRPDRHPSGGNRHAAGSWWGVERPTIDDMIIRLMKEP